jgi:YidC/Oxa1 family membrane protein insertase
MEFLTSLIYPFEWIVAWILWAWHTALTSIGLPPASGAAWVLSVVGLVVVMRAAMIPLFVKQIHASRKMQLIQPEMQKIQKKYKGKTDPESRQAMTQETMDLYKRTGTNPFSSCMPILLQSPFFFGLFRVLNGLEAIATGRNDPIGPITREVAAQAEASTLFGAQLSDKFIGAESLATQLVTVLLIVLMSATTFTTQRQLMMKNMPASALDNPFARQQKVLLYLMPIFFAISGVNFPIGVLLYWLVTNVWSMSQQFYVIRRMPAPGSPAEKALQERRRRRGKAVEEFTVKGLRSETNGEDGADDANQARKQGQRQQPKRAKKRKGAAPGTSSGQGGAGAKPGASAPPKAKPVKPGTTPASTKGTPAEHGEGGRGA